jgi:hypothetical protein
MDLCCGHSINLCVLLQEVINFVPKHKYNDCVSLKIKHCTSILRKGGLKREIYGIGARSQHTNPAFYSHNAR